MNYDHLFYLVDHCHEMGIVNCVISPGSRSAPLTISFARRSEFRKYIISDERSAGFIALGMAISSGKPSILICTSGSAVYNYAPAIAEASLQGIPLLVLTADRPPEWIDQWDGQTIFQEGIFSKHVVHSCSVPTNPVMNDEKWYFKRIIDQALIHLGESKGPVHINLPFREPFYPSDEESFEKKVNNKFRLVSSRSLVKELSLETFVQDFNNCQKVLLVPGQQGRNIDLIKELDKFCVINNVPILTDVISNLYVAKNSIHHHDVFLKDEDNELKPDLLITWGKSIISKNLKLYLRNSKDYVHYQVQEDHVIRDPYQSITHMVQASSIRFFQELNGMRFAQKEEGYLNIWKEKDQQVKNRIRGYGENKFSDLTAFKRIIDQIPNQICLHLANSMTVRYANYLGLEDKSGIEVFCNRGTSGIDGSNSTALGAAISDDRTHLLITGDMAFFYDRNAFWHNYNVPNLKIIVMNNSGGGIFRMIPQSSDLPELEEFFETNQTLSARNLAKEFDFGFYFASNFSELDEGLNQLFNQSQNRKTKILEIKTDKHINEKVFRQFINKQE